MATLAPPDRSPVETIPADPATVRETALVWSRSTPGRLRLASVGVAVLIGLALVTALVVANNRRSAASAARSTAEGPLIDAQTLSVRLSDADTTAAASFLAAGAPSTELTTRYQNDLADAAATLSRLSSQTSSASAADIQKLTTEIPIFTGLVETARVNAEQGRVVGAAYLGEANSLMRDEILPAADNVYRATKADLARSDAGAGSHLALAAAALVVAVIGLVLLQWGLSRRFRRTLNLPMVIATVLVVIAGVWTVVALGAQGRAVDQAHDQGSDPLATLTEAQVQAQQLRADDDLTLVTRDTNPAYQTDYDGTADQLLATVLAPPSDGGAGPTADELSAAFAQVQNVHGQLRKSDFTDGKPLDAIALVTGTSPTDQPAVADHLEQVLAAAVAARSQHFGVVADSSLDDLRGLIVGLFVLGVAAIALVLLGARRRPYR